MPQAQQPQQATPEPAAIENIDPVSNAVEPLVADTPSPEEAPVAIEESPVSEVIDPQEDDIVEVPADEAEVTEEQAIPEGVLITEAVLEAPASQIDDVAVLDEIINTAPIESTGVTALIQEPVAPTANSTTEASGEKSEEEKYLDDIRVSGTVEQKRMLAAVETFSEQMRPKVAIPPEKGVTYQYEFLKHLLWILEKEYDAFRGGWNVLLVYFFLYHGKATAANYSALSEFSTHRFLHAWTRGEANADAYRNLIVLLRATRNKETRVHDIKTIMLEKIAPEVISANALNNLKKFYAV